MVEKLYFLKFCFSSSTAASRIDDDLNEEDDVEEEEDEDEDAPASEEKPVRNVQSDNNSSPQRSTPGYVNIRRTRPTTTPGVSRYISKICYV